ncbi:hypothetical protein [Litorimonas sp. WD9-15]|uniref:hypothetical protein n=1 Tax=Litorimonas sp. WD9-15 TaxID=3418716 RepID=UPI003D04DBA8
MTQPSPLDLHPDLTRSDICFHMRRLISACGGLVKSGEVIGLGKSQMSNFQNATKTDFPRLDQILALEAWCGEPIVTAALAAVQGVTALDCDTRPDLTQQSIGLTALTAQLSAATAEATRDGIITEAEAANLRDLRGQLDDALDHFDARKNKLRSVS